MNEKFYKQAFKRAKELQKILGIADKKGNDYTTQWCKTMEGSGPPVPDTLVWKERYEKLVEENRLLQLEIESLSSTIKTLKRRKKG